MPAVNLSPVANLPQFFDNNGAVLSGGFIFTYVAGSTSVLATTYSTSGGTTANPNPIQLDSSGRSPAELWLTVGQRYNIVVRAADATTILWSADQIQGMSTGTSSVTSVFTRSGDVIAVDGDYSLNLLGDVFLGGPTVGQALIYNGSAWTNAPVGNTGVTSFNTRTGDVTLSSLDVTNALTFLPLNKAGDSMSGDLNMGTRKITNLVMAVSPTDTDVANVAYVNAAIAGLTVHAACVGATTADLGATYTAGVAGQAPDIGTGVGAKLTGPDAPLSVDGVTPTLGQRVLVKNQVNNTQNGIYTLTTVGVTSLTAWVLTRSSDFNNSIYGDVSAGEATFIQLGTNNASTTWVQTAVGSQSPNNVTRIGVDAITFTQFGAVNVYTAGTGLGLSGNTFFNTGVLSITTNSGLSANVSANGAVSITNTGVTAFNTRTGAVALTSADVTDALGYIPGTGSGTVSSVTAISTGANSAAMTVSSSPITTAGTLTFAPNLFTGSTPGVVPPSGGSPSNFLRADGSWASPAGGVTAFNTRTGSVTLVSGDVISALGYTPGAGTVTSVNVNPGTGLSGGGVITTSGVVTLDNTGVLSFNARAGAINLLSGDVTGALGFTPYSNSNPSGFISGITSGNVTSALGYTPYSTTNPAGFISGINSGNVTSALGYVPVNKAGDVMGGALFLASDPTSNLQAATKQYVDTVAAGTNIHAACDAATLTALSVTYSNGSGGVGATLTGVGVLPLIDGVSLVTTQRVLVKNQGAALQNGVYTVTATTPNFILTRGTDFDQSGEIAAGDLTFISGGSQAGQQWAQITPAPITLGSTPLVFTQFSGSVVYTGGAGINVSGSVITNTGVRTNQAGSGISISSSTGDSTITNNGVLSFNGRTDGVSLVSSDVTTALGFTPYSNSNPSGFISGITSGNVTTALGFVPYNSTNPNGFISGISGTDVTNALGFVPYNSSNPSGFTSNTGTVTSVTVSAGAGLSGGGTVSTTGTISLSNTGVTSIAAGTGVGVSASTGAVTVSIGQAVGTGNNVQFNALGVGTSNSTGGTILASGNITAFSDIRLKKDIELIEDALYKVKQLRGVTFTRIDSKQKGLGLIAQEVQLIAPETVETSGGGYLSVAYGNLVGLLVEAIKELEARVAHLEGL